MAYSEEDIERIFSEVLEYIEEGKSLRSILLSNDMPSSRTFYSWLDEDKEKVKRYARATEIRAESIFEDMLEIADDGTNDFMTITKGEISYNVEDKEVTNLFNPGQTFDLFRIVKTFETCVRSG